MARSVRLSSSDIFLATSLYAFSILFILAPILSLVAESIISPTGLTARYYVEFFTDPFTLSMVWNSLVLSIIVVATTSAIAIPLAYMLARYRLKFKWAIRSLLLSPMITPAFIWAIALYNLLGTYGTLNIVLRDWFGVRPIELLGSLFGLALVETIHLYPFVLLNAEASFASISRDTEEVAEVHGASGAKRFFAVTIPLALPGWVTGAMLVFVFAFSDWVSPLILRQPYYLASEVYSAISEGYGLDPRLYRLGLVGAVLITVVAIGSLLVMRAFIERKRYELKGVGRLIDPSFSKKVTFYALSSVVAALGIFPLIWIFLRSVSDKWFLTAFPTEFTLRHFSYVFREAAPMIMNSVTFAGIALGIDILVGIAAAYYLTRSTAPGKAILDSMLTMVLIMPGIVLGIGYLIMFSGPPLPLARSYIVLPLVMAAHRLPFVVRSAYAAFYSLDRSLEEVAFILGASRAYTLAFITLRLCAKAVAAGGIFALVYALQEISALIFLYKPGFETTTIGIFNLFISGANFEGAAALGVILTAVVGFFIAVAFRLSERATAYQVT